MWTRREIKEIAKRALERNYWKIVLVSVLAMLIGLSFNYKFSKNSVKDGAQGFKDGWNGVEISADIDVNGDSLSSRINRLTQELSEKDEAFVVGYVIGAVVVAIVVFVAILIIRICLIYPLHVGISRFMLKSVDDVAKVSEVGYAFDHNYKNVVITMFLTDLRIFLWALLFIIPGIIKAYEYRMVSYILAENPGMGKDEAWQLSKQMMDGNKWKAFVLDLSFIPWHILALVTCGLAGVFYVVPYIQLTNAALCRALIMTDEDTAIEL